MQNHHHHIITFISKSTHRYTNSSLSPTIAGSYLGQIKRNEYTQLLMAFAKANSKSHSNALLYFSRILLVYFVQISSSHNQMYTNAFLCISLPKTGVSDRVGSDGLWWLWLAEENYLASNWQLWRCSVFQTCCEDHDDQAKHRNK